MESTVYLHVFLCMNFQTDFRLIIRCKEMRTERETREFKGKGMNRKGLRDRREDWPRLIIDPELGGPPLPPSKAATSLPFFWRQGPIEMFSRRRPYLRWVPILDRNYVSWFPMPLVLWGRKLIVSCFSHSWWPKLWDFPNRPELYRSVCVERFLSGPNSLFPPLFYALGIVGI